MNFVSFPILYGKTLEYPFDDIAVGRSTEMGHDIEGSFFFFFFFFTVSATIQAGVTFSAAIEFVKKIAWQI